MLFRTVHVVQNNPHLVNALTEKAMPILRYFVSSCHFRTYVTTEVASLYYSTSSDYRVRESALLGVHKEVFMGNVAVKSDSFTARVLLRGGRLPWVYM